jgi:hypothetical protein
MRFDVDAAVRTGRTHRGLIAHEVQKVADKFGRTVPFQLLVNLFEDEVPRLLLDVIGNDTDGLIFLLNCWSFDGLTFEGRLEFIGVVLHLEEAHCRANLVESALRKPRAREFLKPLDCTLIGVGVGRLVLVITGDAAEPDLSGSLQRKDNDVADLHFTHKAVELTGADRNCTCFFIGVDLFIAFFVLGPRVVPGKIADSLPTYGDDVLLLKQALGVAGPARMNAPEGFSFSIIV